MARCTSGCLPLSYCAVYTRYALHGYGDLGHFRHILRPTGINHFTQSRDFLPQTARGFATALKNSSKNG